MSSAINTETAIYSWSWSPSSIVSYSSHLIPITNKQCQPEETLLRVCLHFHIEHSWL